MDIWNDFVLAPVLELHYQWYVAKYAYLSTFECTHNMVRIYMHIALVSSIYTRIAYNQSQSEGRK